VQVSSIAGRVGPVARASQHVDLPRSTAFLDEQLALSTATASVRAAVAMHPAWQRCTIMTSYPDRQCAVARHAISARLNA
jgi:hypothetical protein